VRAIWGTVFNLAKCVVIILTIVLGVAVTSCGAVANASCPKVGFTVVELHATSETRSLRAGRNQPIFVRRELITTTSDISDIKLEHPDDGDDDDVLILIKFTPVADQRLHDATTNHSGMRIAFLFDDEVLNNVVWEGPYGTYTGGTQVSIPHGMNQARRLMKAIRGCTAATMGDRTP
jgi:preprotein translocase subunit SecD